MTNFEQQNKKYKVVELSKSESEYAGSYVLPEGKTLDDLDSVEFGTSDGKLEFRLKFKDGVTGVWNTTSAYTPKEHIRATEQLGKVFGEDKFK